MLKLNGSKCVAPFKNLIQKVQRDCPKGFFKKEKEYHGLNQIFLNMKEINPINKKT